MEQVITCYTKISAEYLFLDVPRHIEVKSNVEFNIFPNNQPFAISSPFFTSIFSLHHLPRHLKQKAYRHSKCVFLFYISHQSTMNSSCVEPQKYLKSIVFPASLWLLLQCSPHEVLVRPLQQSPKGIPYV